MFDHRRIKNGTQEKKRDKQVKLKVRVFGN